MHGGSERRFLYVTIADFRCPIPLSSATQEAEPGMILRARISITVGLVTFLANALKRRGNEDSLTVRGFVFGCVGPCDRSGQGPLESSSCTSSKIQIAIKGLATLWCLQWSVFVDVDDSFLIRCRHVPIKHGCVALPSTTNRGIPKMLEP